ASGSRSQAHLLGPSPYALDLTPNKRSTYARHRLAPRPAKVPSPAGGIMRPVAQLSVPIPDPVDHGHGHPMSVLPAGVDRSTFPLAAHRSADGYVLSAQNGLNELVIKDVVGDARTMGCFVNFGADYLEPGAIQYAGRGAVVLGEIDGRVTPRIGELHRAFRDF